MNLRKAATCCLLAALAGGVTAAAQDRIVQPLDRTRLVALKGHVHPRALADTDQGPVDPAMPIRQATLLFKPAASIDAFLAEQQIPGAPNYHKWLTPEQFGDRFGLTANDIAKVSAWLESQRLKVDNVARGRNWINFSGTAGQAARTFRTRFHRYRVNGETHFANVDEPSVPAALEDVVGGFLGLDDFKLRSNIVRPQYTSSKGVHTLTPDDLATIYNIAPLYAAGMDGAGQKIAIIGDSALDLSDIRAFRKQFNLPASDPQQILVGDDPGINDDVVESNLDIEWAGAVARGAKILYVYGQSVYGAVQFAVDENLAPVLSLSFGGCEAYNRVSFRAVAQQASAQGITWLAASGDTGAAECDRTSAIPQAAKGLAVGFPASIPEITSVGGTQFDDAKGKHWATTNNVNGASALGYIPETVWNDTPSVNGFSAGGGGASLLFPKPYWQSGPGVPDDKARDVPDVSLTASADHVGYQIYVYGAFYSVGGTSASAPSMAGVVALLNQYLTSKSILARPGLGNINPALYRLAQSTKDVFHDVTTGDNAVRCALGSPNCVEGFVGHRAGPGYDLATGLGSIDAYNLVTQWNAGTASTTTVTADPASAALTDTVHLTATVRGGQVGTAPTGAISFLARNQVDAVIGTADLTANGASSTATLVVAATSVIGGDGTVTAIYNGDKLYNASSATVTVGVNRPAAGSLVVPNITPNPVYKQSPYGNWPYTLKLSEKAGVQTTLTGFTVNGVNNLGAFGGVTIIPAKGTIGASLAGSGLTVPINRVFHFEGKDLDGATWSRDVTVAFLDALYPGASTGMALGSVPSTVLQNPKAVPACQFAHRLILQETGGFLMQITTLRQGTTNLSTSLQQLFGTTHLAPYGTLQGDICLSSATTLGAKTYTVSGISELGNTVTATLDVTLAAASAAPAAMAAAPQTITLAVTDAFRSAATDVVLTFSGGEPQWTASVVPGANWLTVSPLSGTGSGPLKIAVNAAGLSRGAHQGTVTVQSGDAIPQVIAVPVTFVVGTSQSTVITAIANGASYTQAFAPGVLMTVFGTQLADVTRSAGVLPLPLELGGVSATVNGVSAPLYYVSPGQINVQVPYETGTGLAVLGVNNGGQVASFPFTVAPAAPGLFTAVDGSLTPAATARQGQAAVAYITGDGDTTTFLITGASPPTGTATSRLPRPRLPVTVTVGGVAATVSFAGTPVGVVGVSQVNFTVPAAVPPGVQPVIVSVGGVRTQTGRLTVTQ
ncbi:MAG: protease pro-enzyme activation domain-containing protein [Candidatus Solibacter sp.]|nr:protease pro-enzyme activation domain-containing protein [Candidatus Solibacter sp.]